MDVQPNFKGAKTPKAPKAKGRARATEPLATKCEIPGCQRLATERHHKLRRSQGGSDDPSNTMDLCSFHHQSIHAHPEAAYQTGWLIRRAGA